MFMTQNTEPDESALDNEKVKFEAKKLFNQPDINGMTPLHHLINRGVSEHSSLDQFKAIQLLKLIGKNSISYFIFGKPCLHYIP